MIDNSTACYVSPLLLMHLTPLTRQLDPTRLARRLKRAAVRGQPRRPRRALGFRIGAPAPGGHLHPAGVEEEERVDLETTAR